MIITDILGGIKVAEGIIYILINEAMPGYVKIGKTSNSVEERMKSLDSTGVPLPFECFYASKVKDMDSAEKLLHDAFGGQRTRAKREFFEVDPARIASALKLADGEDVTPRDDVVEKVKLLCFWVCSYCCFIW